MTTYAGIGIAIGLLIVLSLAFWLYKRLEKRKKDIVKGKFFDENGGRLLRHMMALSKGSVEKMKLYLIEEIISMSIEFSERVALAQYIKECYKMEAL